MNYKQAKKLDKNLLGISVSFLFVLWSGWMSNMIMPIYAKSFGVSYSLVGIVMAAYSAAMLIIYVPAGSLSDKFGRKSMIMLGNITFLIGILIAAFSENIYHLILSNFMQGLGFVSIAVSNHSLIGDIAPADQRGKYVGYYLGITSIGTTVGPIVGGYVTDIFGYHNLFFVSSVLSFIGLAFAYFMIDQRLLKTGEHKSSVRDTFEVMARMVRNKNTIALIYITTTAIVVMRGRAMMLPLYGEKVVNLSTTEIGIAITACEAFLMLTMTLSPLMADKLGRRPLCICGLITSGVSFFAFYYAKNLLSMALISSVFGLSVGIMESLSMLMRVDLSDPEHRGAFIGACSMFNSIGGMIGQTLIGLISDYFGLFTPFIFIGTLCIITGAAVPFTKEASTL